MYIIYILTIFTVNRNVFYEKNKKTRNHVWLLVYNRLDFSAKHIYVDIGILTLKICIALYEALNAASSINSFYLDSIWYHIKLLKNVL